MPAHPHRHQFDERRPASGARALCCPRERGGNEVGIRSVDRDAGNAVAGRPVGEHADCRLIGDRRRKRNLIVLDTENRRQPPHRACVDRLVPLAQRRPAFADERDGHAARSVAPEGHRHSGDRQRRGRERSGRRQDTPPEVTDVQILSPERRPDLPHLRVEDHPHRVGLGPHRERDAKIPDDRPDDVAVPPPVRSAIFRATPQANSGGIDRFLAERPKPLALKHCVAVLDLPAGKKRFQPVVGRAREQHAAQNFAAFVGGQRGLDRRASEKSVARLA